MFKEKELKERIEDCLQNGPYSHLIFVHGYEWLPFDEFVEKITDGHHVKIENCGYVGGEPYFPKFYRRLQNEIGKADYIYLKFPEAGTHLYTQKCIGKFLFNNPSQKFVVVTNSPEVVYACGDNMIDLANYLEDEALDFPYKDEFIAINFEMEHLKPERK